MASEQLSTPSYWAKDDDPLFEAGHYVESWELQRVTELSQAMRELLRIEWSRRNKIRSINKWSIELTRPLGDRVLNLPPGVIFWCPLQPAPIGHFDGDEDGAVVCFEKGTRIYPSGYEKPTEYIHAEGVA